jgi:hypothetical protein
VTIPVWFIGPPIPASAGRRPSFHPGLAASSASSQRPPKRAFDDYV